MDGWINKVFVDGNFYGAMRRDKLDETKADFRKNALKVLEDTSADHVIYCHIDLDDVEEIQTLWLYNYFPIDDKAFCKTTSNISNKHVVEAVHKS